MMLMINPKKKLSTLWSMVGLKVFKDMPGSLCQGSVHACFECTIWLFPPQVKFPLCTLAEIPRTAAHCIEYAHLIKWDEVHSGEAFDLDDPEHIKWVYDEANKRAELFGIQELHCLSLRGL
ncbi:putative THIF-type NAD/FAD binding, ubiquitin activating enzyme, alpha domain-containing protein [Rosa chinensis]|uniref:Putative THIF-type NAD/FAD binding, ubiquitin activating enzyme, alpha domain-containing protein n=1 Tax=Rosa chinensis TaxID=74649 RepID=A0A2P6SEC1_ROSCH|nr:putative THIF-type NAD/FAD binding, ubiquitin activating enzyme, alpha domain-containing protein [Rosa chinensis]